VISLSHVIQSLPCLLTFLLRIVFVCGLGTSTDLAQALILIEILKYFEMDLNISFDMKSKVF
jgi:hypothetical protein